ncbi:MAG: EF-P beta-lysylation protein EpmB [Aureliella sp.]
MAQILTTNGSSVEATFAVDKLKQLTQQLSGQPREPISWQSALKRAIRSGHELCQTLNLPPELASFEAASDFPLFAPWEYVARMQVGNPRDPLLLQVLAAEPEMAPQAGALRDPVGDAQSERLPGLLHKYDRRVLMITTGACAIHCRYCFRRHYPYDTAPRGREGWEPSLRSIAADSSLDEVILSGGDPLTLADSSLAWLAGQIGAMAHIRRLRIHTRLPVVIPQRVCAKLLDWVRQSPLAVYFVLHFNHAAEIDQPVRTALRQLRQAGATLLNQAVMLRGINDSCAAQTELCLSLVNEQVLPYYVHQLDPVQGAMHFAVPDSTAVAIMADVQRLLPGYAVPKLVREIAGQPSKTWITHSA